MRLLVAATLVAACRFDADYAGGTYACEDGVCPEGLVCRAARCVDPDLPIDAPLPVDGPDADPAMPDAEPALTCADPGVLADDDTIAGTTLGGVNRLSTMCTAGIYNGFDDVYAVTLAAPGELRVEITGGTNVAAYVIDTCVSPPPACVDNMVATDGFALTLDLPGDEYFVVVDTLQAGAGADYTLTVRIGP